ncbi:MAG: hypothetical protein GY821_02335 [Gammaproteobacteria bacterium]|nr:hypothetical protein [Gammaproteobacteria bacterium]
MQRWRRAVLEWLNQCRQQIDFTCLPSTIEGVSDANYLAFQLDYYQNRYWHVHLGKPKKNHLHNVNYLGRYIKRPPIAESKLRHYNGKNVTFSYLNHTTKQDPLACLLCSANMRLAGLTFCYDTAQLRGFHQKLAGFLVSPEVHLNSGFHPFNAQKVAILCARL